MKKYLHSFTNRFLGLLLISLLSSTSFAAERQTLDRIVAVVDTEIITLRELEEKAAPILSQVAGEDQNADKKKAMLRKVLDAEINERIINKEIETNRDRLGVTSAEIDRAVDDVMRMNNMSREQLQGALYSQGMTWAEYREKMKGQMERARIVQFAVQGRVHIGENEVKRRCTDRQNSGTTGVKICASHILVRTPPASSSDDISAALAKAEKLRTEVLGGADFATMAREHSDDAGAGDGSLGCFGPGEMVAEFEKAAFSLKIGDISQIVRTEFGFHIIRVNEHKKEEAPAAGMGCEDENELAPYRNELYQERMAQEMDIWLGELRKKVFIEIRI